MTALAALGYARRGWPVFPCHWQGERRKRPLIERGFHAATTDDEAQIRAWWRRWPDALIGVPTGRAIGAVVLDIDVKDDSANGFDSLDGLGVAIVPDTPMAHTASGGLHLYFAPPDGVDVRNTAGQRGSGIGPGLDWRGDGGYVIAPSPGSLYSWDPYWNLDTAPLARVPAVLLPRPPERMTPLARPVKPTTGLSPYAEGALDGACRRIIGAPGGQQESALNAETFARSAASRALEPPCPISSAGR
jgi:putative DNA primase/helicase